MGTYTKGLAVLSIGLALALATPAAAYTIEPVADPDNGLFSISPSRTEVNINPGASTTQRIIIANRLGKRTRFTVSVESFTASQDPDGGAIIGGEAGALSAVSWITPELTEFVLESGQRIYFNVGISAPASASAGGHYGSVLFESHPFDQVEGSNVKIITKVGALLLINVMGPMDERGRITEFTTDTFRSTPGPIPFAITFANDGNTHQLPYGTISIHNIFGTTVGSVQVEPWYVLPNSVRRKRVEWNRGWLWGPYTATLTLTHGRSTVQAEQATVRFWVVPWRLVVLILLVAAAAWLVWRRYLSRMHISFQR